jgi:hypothetical protein
VELHAGVRVRDLLALAHLAPVPFAIDVLAIVLLAAPAAAQETAPACRFLCAPEFKVEPTFTITNLFGRAQLAAPDGSRVREPREHEFELILSLDLPTVVPWFGFTVEAMFLPFDRESTPELEFETNFHWLDAARTGGWLTSHVDIVDKFSSAARPSDARAYTHKLNLELDTAFHVFNRAPQDQWLHGVEIEGSLDYVATGLPRAGDGVDGLTYFDAASPWSFSLVIVIPVAP